jgi:hypothetical protein
MADTVAVETYSGDGAYGPIYAASVNVTCNINAKRKLVRNAAGDEVVSETTLHVKAADAAKFTPETRVTIATKVTTVIGTSPKAFRGVVVHVEVTCK